MNRISLSLIVLALLLITACSSPEKLIETPKTEAPSIYPAWYHTTGFVADSTSFTMSATAVASDSVTAIQRAELESRMLLESYLSKEMESVRTKLESSGSNSVKKPDFILTLRNAHAAVEKEAVTKNSLSEKTELGYRGFAQTSITKTALNSLMQKDFSGKTNYWKEFSGSPAYHALVN